MVRELITMIGMSPHDETSWMIPVTKTEATRDVGMAELLKSVEDHQHWLTKSGKRVSRLAEFLKNEVADILAERLQHSLKAIFETQGGQDTLKQLMDREIDPYEAANRISGGGG